MTIRKRYGQHFLTHSDRLQALSTAIAPQSIDHIVEIGPGRGALSDYLINRSRTLDLIEIDRDLIPLLKERYPEKNVHIYEADILQFQLLNLTHPAKLRVVGNIPYNISTPLLFHLFNQIDLIQDIHILLQQELANRLTASVNTPHYGRLSIFAQLYCHITPLLTIDPTAFYPPPKVSSTFIRLTPHTHPLKVKSFVQLQMLVRDAFQQRRKMLSNSLKKWVTESQWAALGINPKQRPQELSIEDYIRISDFIGNQV